MNEMQIESVCRTCLSSSSLLRPLFPHPDQIQSFVRALYLSTGLKVEHNDGLPQNICRDCSNTIETSMRFRSQSQASEKKLLHYFSYRKQNFDSYSGYSHDDSSVFAADLNDSCEIKIENGHEASSEADLVKDEIFNSQLSPSTEFHVMSDDEDTYPKATQNATKSVKTKRQSESCDRKAYLDLVEGPIVPKQPVKCKICKKFSKCLNSFEKHAMSHLGYNILCEFCAKACISTANLLRHQRRKHGLARDNSFPCSICGYQAIDKEQLEVHERRLHTKERPFVCDDCGAAFFSKRVLIQHQANHRTDKPFQCNLCSSKFKLRCRLTKHIHRVHTKNYCKYTYGCYVCLKKYSRATHVRKHIAKIHGVSQKQQEKVLRFENMNNLHAGITVSPNISPHGEE